MQRNIFVVAAVILAAIAIYFLNPFQQDSQEVVPEKIQNQIITAVEKFPAEETAPLPDPLAIDETPVVVLDPIVAAPSDLNNSDATASTAVLDLALELGPWMAPDELIRKWVLATDNLAKGDLVNKHQPWVYAMPSFKADGTKDMYTLSADNFQRATPLLDAALSIPPEKLARYYQNWLPLLEQAYAELGKPDTFDSRFQALLTLILAVETPEGPIALERKHVLYTYKDTAQEKATDLEKLMWRLGPDNSARLQAYVQQLQPKL